MSRGGASNEDSLLELVATDGESVAAGATVAGIGAAMAGGGDHQQAATADAALQQAGEEMRRAVPGGRAGQDHRTLLQWTMEMGVDWHYIVPGKQAQNALIESIDGKLRVEYRNTNLLGLHAVALVKIETWRIEGSTTRPQISIANQTPTALAAANVHTKQRGRTLRYRRGFALGVMAETTWTGSDMEQTLPSIGEHTG